jgi:hypothetical protein
LTRADGFQVVAEEIAEAEVLLIAEVLAVFEQQPTGLLQDRAPNGLGKALRFGQVRLPSPNGTSSTATTPQRRAIDAPRGVQQENEESPQGNELKAPFGEFIVAGGPLWRVGQTLVCWLCFQEAQFGFLANRRRSEFLTLARRLLSADAGTAEPVVQTNAALPTWRCPHCRSEMRIGPNLSARQLAAWRRHLDSS